MYYYIIIHGYSKWLSGYNCRICGPSLTETSLCGAWLLFAIRITNKNKKYLQFVSRNLHKLTPRYGWTRPIWQRQKCTEKDSALFFTNTSSVTCLVLPRIEEIKDRNRLLTKHDTRAANIPVTILHQTRHSLEFQVWYTIRKPVTSSSACTCTKRYT